jgi:hypothetical protein
MDEAERRAIAEAEAAEMEERHAATETVESDSAE